jgi:hypothetical protein
MRGPRAHLAGEDDELAMVAPLVALIPVFAALLDMRAEAAMTNRIARAPIIGRPVGAPEWIATRERRLGRPLAPGKPGPQPRMQPDPRGNCSCCKERVNCHRNPRNYYILRLSAIGNTRPRIL